MPVRMVICGGIDRPGIDQGRELAEHFAAAHLDRADLGDRLGQRRAARCLQIDDHEGDLTQRLAQLVEAALGLAARADHRIDRSSGGRTARPGRAGRRPEQRAIRGDQCHGRDVRT